jgi:hypothetical protein
LAYDCKKNDEKRKNSRKEGSGVEKGTTIQEPARRRINKQREFKVKYQGETKKEEENRRFHKENKRLFKVKYSLKSFLP